MFIRTIIVVTGLFLYTGVHALTFSDGEAAFKRKDFTAAYSIWKKLAQQGDRDSQYKLALMNSGFLPGGTFDEKASLFWMTKAAEQGHVKAQRNMAYLYYQGHKSAKKDVNTGLYWFEQAANQGDLRSQYMLGTIFDAGVEVKQDYERALKWFRKASLQGDAASSCFIGQYYEFGRGVEMNITVAISAYKTAAKKNFGLAEFHLGHIYQHGRRGSHDIQKDPVKAVYWYERAAKHYSHEAALNLGVMYTKGIDVEQDFEKGIAYLKQAADQGNQKAKFNLKLIERRYGEK